MLSVRTALAARLVLVTGLFVTGEHFAPWWSPATHAMAWGWLASLIGSPQTLAALEVQVESVRSVECEEAAAPRAILVRLTPRTAWLGEEGRAPVGLVDDVAVRDALRALKNARPDREVIDLVVDDGVSYDRVVAFVDVAHGAEIRAINVAVKRDLDPHGAWRRPPPSLEP
jgi:hypothetical protein